MIHYHKLTLVILCLSLLSACGGGGGSSNTSSANIETGTFVDSPVANLQYRTESQSGKTNPAGEFKYKSGETITFSIGNFDFPSALAGLLLTPLDLVGTSDINNPAVIKISRLLQSLDLDGDPENGIVIGDEAHAILSRTLLELGSPDFYLDVGNILVDSGTSNLTVVDEATALAHLKTTIDRANDKTPPVITLLGANIETVIQGQFYIEKGATAVDTIDGEVAVSISGSVDTSIIATYTITYTAIDNAGNLASLARTVSVVEGPIDIVAPIITLIGSGQLTITKGETYLEPGFYAIDLIDGVIDVVVSGQVDTSTSGTYLVTYSATDNAGNSVSENRTVYVVDVPLDNEAPIITLNGESDMSIAHGGTYSELGANARDIVDGVVNVEMTGQVVTAVAGTYVITYTATDLSQNTATKFRTVIVEDAVTKLRPKRVLYIALDAIRPDILAAVDTPNFDKLKASGIYSDRAQTGDIPESASGWSNSLTGVWQDKHKVTGNDQYGNSNFSQYPDFISRIESFDPGYNTAYIVSWDKLAIEGSVVHPAYKAADFKEYSNYADYSLSAGLVDEISVLKAKTLLATEDIHVMFTYLLGADLAGHTLGGPDPDHGWHITRPAYTSAIEKIDAQIGELIASLENRATYDDEDWLIVVSTDHGGGSGTTVYSHGENAPYDRTVFVLFSGEKAVTRTPDGGLIYPHAQQVDIAPTIFAHLGIDVPDNWGLDGKPILNETTKPLAMFDVELVTNGDAESRRGFTNMAFEAPVVGWQENYGGIPIKYGTPNYPTKQAHPLGGNNFFAGGTSAQSTMIQTVDVSNLGINSSSMYSISADLGGYSDSEDTAALNVRFLNNEKSAALYWDESTAYFFRGSQYRKFDIATDAVTNEAREIGSYWAGLDAFNGGARNIDAALNYGNGKVYFFKGAEYIRYDVSNDAADPGFPKLIADQWPGLELFIGGAKNLDAAFLSSTNGDIYFFKGNEYIRFDVSLDETYQSENLSYPRDVSFNTWPGLHIWSGKIDAAVIWPGDKVYLFKEGSYVRYNLITDEVDADFPRDVTNSSWEGLSEWFKSNRLVTLGPVTAADRSNANKLIRKRSRGPIPAGTTSIEIELLFKVEVNKSDGYADNISVILNADGSSSGAYIDADGDQFYDEIEDCNDSDSNIYPGAPRLDNGKDNDCDGVLDDFGQLTIKAQTGGKVESYLGNDCSNGCFFDDSAAESGKVFFATASENYVFAGWSGDNGQCDDASASCRITAPALNLEAITVSAQFSPIQPRVRRDQPWMSAKLSYYDSAQEIWMGLGASGSSEHRQLGDFNGDGKTDVLKFIPTSNGKYDWAVSYAGSSGFVKINDSVIKPASLHFGDFDGDRRTDVFWRETTTGFWWYCPAAACTEWQELNGRDSSIDHTQLRFADFDGDGKTDVFQLDILPGGSTKEWFFKKGGKGSWLALNVDTTPDASVFTSVGVKSLRFGDFNGDGKADVFKASPIAFDFVFPTKWKWSVSYGGTENWVELNQSTVPMDELHFGFLDGDNKTDVFDRDNDDGEIAYISGGKGTGSINDWIYFDKNTSSDRIGSAHMDFGDEFGMIGANLVGSDRIKAIPDFNGDGQTDILYFHEGVPEWQKSVAASDFVNKFESWSAPSGDIEPDEIISLGGSDLPNVFSANCLSIPHIQGIAKIPGKFIVAHDIFGPVCTDLDFTALITLSEAEGYESWIDYGDVRHPGANQASGSLVLAPEEGGDDNDDEDTFFFDYSDPNNPKELSYVFEGNSGASGIVYHHGKRRHYMVINHSALYASNGLSIADSEFRFTKLSGDNVVKSQGGTNLIYDKNNGRLYVVALNTNDAADEFVTLTEVDVGDDLVNEEAYDVIRTIGPEIIYYRADIGTPHYGPSFRWAGTVNVTSQGVEIYAMPQDIKPAGTDVWRWLIPN